MDFHHLKYFVEVADKKSFSKAARTLHISQSAISRTIKALEEELGVVLFMRNAKAVELTDAGTIFLSHAKRVVFMFEHLKTDFENEFKLEQGTVLIGLPPITGAPIFANLLGAFKQEYPQINWTSTNTARRKSKSASRKASSTWASSARSRRKRTMNRSS